MALLRGYDFPGNVRELRNLVERLVIMTPGTTIGADQVRAVLRLVTADGASTPRRLSEYLQQCERELIELTLHATGGNMTQAASQLGIERSHLYKKMRKLGMRPESWDS
jgi:DNA-binding NtrC family response regulator